MLLLTGIGELGIGNDGHMNPYDDHDVMSR